jgi:hypothetical protein
MFLTLLGADLGMRIYGRQSPRYGTWMEWIDLAWAIVCFLVALSAVLQRRWVVVGIYTFLAAMSFHAWWDNDRNRRRRKKLLERSSGVVRDMGGRLRVVRPAED